MSFGGTGLAARIERGLEAWGRFVLRRPAATLVASLALALALSIQAFDIGIDNSDARLLRPDDPALLRLEAFRDRFGRNDLILVALQPADVFERSFLETLRAFHRDLEAEVPHVREVESLVNARSVRGEDDTLIVEGVLDDWPETDAELARARARILANPLYRNVLISDSADMTLVSVRLEQDEPQTSVDDAIAGFETGNGDRMTIAERIRLDPATEAAVRAVREIASRYRSPELAIHVAGSPVLAERLNAISRRDMARYLVLALGAVAALLFVLFRRLSGVLVPVAVVLAAIGSTLGVMALCGTPISVITQILPTFLFVVGVCDSIHVLTIAYRRMGRGDTREDAIVFALRHSGFGVLLTSLTTAAGLLSFSTADVQPIVDLGIFAPIGVAFALLFTLTLLPAVFVLAPIRAAEPRRGRARLEGILVAMGGVATRRPGRVIAASALLLALSVGAALQLRVSFHSLEWFPERDPLRIASAEIDRRMRGSVMLEVLLDAGSDDALHEPALLRGLEAFSRRAGALALDGAFVGKATSIADVVKEIHQALSEGDPEQHRIPDARRVVAQELLLFENSGSDDLETVSDSRFRLARATLRLPRVDATLYPAVIDEAEEIAREELAPFGRIESTGGLTVYTRIVEASSDSMLRSYAVALLAITPLMILVMGGVVRGLIAMIPNLAPIAVGLGLMHVAAIPLDLTTMLLGSIVLGLAVDDTIHFMVRFDRELAAVGDPHIAVRRTLESTGTALLFTSLALTAGFASLMLGYMVNVSNFGLLLAVATAVALLADLMLAPALMTLVVRRTARAPALRC